MVYTILISIVFIAEVIITATIIQNLIKLDRTVIEANSTITEIKPTIKDICVLARKISEQWKILAQDFIDKVKTNGEDLISRHLLKILIGLITINLNFKFIKKIRNSKLTKTLAKGWSLIESMV